MKKIAVLFPGIGYHTDKPLLYYSRKVAVSRGYEVLEISYKKFRPGIKGDPARMREAGKSALAQAEEILADADWDKAEEILFISKSIGTVVAAAYAEKMHLDVRHIFFTPLKETFTPAAPGSGIAFHGTADPWASDEEIEAGCREKKIPLIQIPGANHSLETGCVERDLQTLVQVMAATEEWLEEHILSGTGDRTGKR